MCSHFLSLQKDFQFGQEVDSLRSIFGGCTVLDECRVSFAIIIMKGTLCLPHLGLTNGLHASFYYRIAEELIFGSENVTTGASNDFMQVSRVARQMVERFGFSKKIGQLAIGGAGGNPFIGQQVSQQSDHSMATADVIDAEVRELVETAYSRAKTLMQTHINILHKLAALLIEKESVDGEEFLSLFIDGQAELYMN